MVSALAPGSVAETWMVGKSTCGSGAIGSIGKVTIPMSSNAAARSVVPIGRRMNGSEMLIVAREALPQPSDADARAQLQLPIDHDLLARGDAGFYQRRGAARIGRRHLDQHHLDGIVSLDDVGVDPLGAELHGGGGMVTAPWRVSTSNRASTNCPGQSA